MSHEAATREQKVLRLRRPLIAAATSLILGAGLLAAPGVMADEEHDHSESYCDENHPAVKKLIGGVQKSLAENFVNIPTMTARGFIPYFDAMLPGGYPPGGEGIGHWLNPDWIEDGHLMDPTRPESILTDEWNRPIGMMFIAEEDTDGPVIYTNKDGTPCSPWHPHTDMPARFSWWFYEMVYGGRALKGDVDIDPVTPMLLHVWAIPNDKGFAAHDGPEAKYRKGKPAIWEQVPGSLKPGLPLPTPPAPQPAEQPSR